MGNVVYVQFGRSAVAISPPNRLERWLDKDEEGSPWNWSWVLGLIGGAVIVAAVWGPLFFLG